MVAGNLSQQYCSNPWLLHNGCNSVALMYQIYFFGSIILAVIAVLLLVFLFWKDKKLSEKTKIILAMILIIISPLWAYMYYGRVSIQDTTMYDTPIPEIERQAIDCPTC